MLFMVRHSMPYRYAHLPCNLPTKLGVLGVTDPIYIATLSGGSPAEPRCQPASHNCSMHVLALTARAHGTTPCLNRAAQHTAQPTKRVSGRILQCLQRLFPFSKKKYWRTHPPLACGLHSACL